MNLHNNVNPHEIKNFENVSEDWWASEGAFKTLHDINPLRLAFVTQQVDLKHKKVIDVGCGGGILAEALARCDAEVTGIDMSASAIEIAKQHAQAKPLSIQYLKTTAEEIAQQKPAQFDIVTCMEMLEHVPDPASVIQACARLVKPNGHLFFSTLNRTLKSYLFAIVGAEYVLKLLPRGLHHYEQFIKPSELAAWGRDANLDIQKTCGINYNPFSKAYSLSNGIDVNYLVYAVRRS